jgi:predicted small lipoprotein YifL
MTNLRKLLIGATLALTLTGCYRTGPIPTRPHPPVESHPHCPNGQRAIGYLPDGVTLDCV